MTIRLQNLGVLAIIPARGGSKGVPRKNIKDLCGKPLIAWTIEAALKSGAIDRCIVSTDDEEIAEVSRRFGADVPFLRPTNLASDASTGMDPVLHALDLLPGYKYVILMQPTSPLREAIDVRSAIKIATENNYPSFVSVSEAARHPFYCFKLAPDNFMAPFLVPPNNIRRQDLPRAYALNGAIYIAQVDWLLKNKSFISEKTRAFLMPFEKSIDIDTITDFEIAEFLLSKKLSTHQ